MTRDFGRYKIAEEVGRGAMGVVYRATDPMIGRVVAIKAINESYIETVGVRREEYLERFQREAEVAGRLSHPHIVKIFDLGPNFIVMEFIEGQSLASLIRAKRRLSPSRILQVVGDVGEALDYAHGNGVVHRDVKPANIMIEPDGTVKVMDFGLARIESSTLTAAGEVLGSASYMAPEVVLGRPADDRSDIFALGVVAYELMTGDRPFGGSSISAIIGNIVRGNPRPARQLNVHLPEDYDAIFARVLAREPEGRYPTASEFASALLLKKWAEPEEAVPAAGEAPDAPTEMALSVDAPKKPPTEGASDRDEDPGGTTVLVASEIDADGVPVEDAGGQTVMMVDVDEVSAPVAAPAPPDTGTLAPTPDGDDLPPEALEPIDDDAPLADLVTESPPAVEISEVPTETQAPNSRLQRLAREAAARGIGASDVLVEEPTPPSPPAAPASSVAVAVAPHPSPAGPVPVAAAPARPPSATNLRLLLALAGGALVLMLAGVVGVAVLVHRTLVRRTATAPESPPPETLAATGAAVAEPPVPKPEATSPTVTPPAAREAATPEPIAPARVAPVLATLSISSDPAGGRVSVGKRALGLTPLQVQVPPGRLAVTIEKEGFKDWRREVTLGPGGSEDLRARLEPLSPKETRPPAGVHAGDQVELTPDVIPPKKLSGESPNLPSRARRQKLSGSVLLEFVVDENGSVTDAKVLESAGELLDQACLEVVKTWRYQPATTQGVRVKVAQKARFTFQAR